MSHARLIGLALVLVASTARADRTVGIVITGDAAVQVAASRAAETWLRKHGHDVAGSLPPEVVNTLVNCLVIDDNTCARGVIDARSTAEAVLYANVAKSHGSNALELTVYWFVKGHEPIAERRACESCTDELMASTLDTVLDTLVGASQLKKGRLLLHSKPEGVTVILDNEAIGVTPIERDLPAGDHTLVLMHAGHKVGARGLTINEGEDAEITMNVVLPVVHVQHSKVLPVLAVGIGLAAMVTGGVLYATSETDDGSQPRYRDSRPPAIGIGAGGLVLAGLGTALWLRHGGKVDSAPVAAVDSRGGMIGWARAF